jgi:hypothetical protein
MSVVAAACLVLAVACFGGAAWFFARRVRTLSGELEQADPGARERLAAEIRWARIVCWVQVGVMVATVAAILASSAVAGPASAALSPGRTTRGR